jgi:hypothetical protein
MIVHRARECPDHPHWHLESTCEEVDARYGRIEFQVVDEAGCPAADVDVMMIGNALSITATDQDGIAVIRLYDSCGPSGMGTNTVAIVEEPSDQVEGLGLPNGVPVVIKLLFRRLGNG